MSEPLSMIGCLLNRALGLGQGGCLEKASAIAAVAEPTAWHAGRLGNVCTFLSASVLQLCRAKHEGVLIARMT